MDVIGIISSKEFLVFLGILVGGGSLLSFRKTKTIKDSSITTATSNGNNSPATSNNNSPTTTTNSGNHSPTTNGPNSPITQNIQQSTQPQSIKIKLTIELNQMAIEVLDAIYIKLKEEYNSNPECCVFYFEDDRPGPFFNLIKSIVPDKDQRIIVMSHMFYHKKFFEKTQDGSWRLTNSGFEAALAIHYELHKKKYSCLDCIDI